MERKLASIRQISSLEPILGADFIELAHVDGWQCVVKKGTLNPGDHVVYFEIDSFLPVEPHFEFLRKSCYRKYPRGKEGFRIKTIKLRGTLSQGLAMPVQDFPNLDPSLELGTDITETLGVTLYEPGPGKALPGDAKGNFPIFIKKTDQERIQNCPKYFELYKDMFFEVTEKLDGTSCTIFYNNGEVGVCSRNLELKENDDSLYWQIAKKYNLPTGLTLYGKNLAIQGEIIGPNIQRNHYKLDSYMFYIFDVWSIDEHRYLLPPERYHILAELDPNYDHVPILENVMLGDTTLQGALKSGPSHFGQRLLREGLVFKSFTDSSISFKAINNEYLLKHED